MVPLNTENSQLPNVMFETDKSRDGDLLVDEMIFEEANLTGPKIRYGFVTGGMRFLVPEGAVSELLHGARIYHLPNAPQWVCGLINMHGNVIPVIDLVSLTGDVISHLSKSNILAIRKHDTAVGVLIDGFPEAVAENEIVTVSEVSGFPAELNNYLYDGVTSNGVIWCELDIFGLLKKLALLHADTNHE